jgi:hypothetical protein
MKYINIFCDPDGRPLDGVEPLVFESNRDGEDVTIERRLSAEEYRAWRAGAFGSVLGDIATDAPAGDEFTE